MDIRILGDNRISKRNHAVFVYDPKSRKTLVLPGDSSGLVYVNEQAVYSPQEIDAFDVIELGKSKFIFVPLCGVNFEWDELGDAVLNDNAVKQNKQNEDAMAEHALRDKILQETT